MSHETLFLLFISSQSSNGRVLVTFLEGRVPCLGQTQLTSLVGSALAGPHFGLDHSLLKRNIAL